jgi:hypothetical protein
VRAPGGATAAQRELQRRSCYPTPGLPGGTTTSPRLGAGANLRQTTPARALRNPHLVTTATTTTSPWPATTNSATSVGRQLRLRWASPPPLGAMRHGGRRLSTGCSYPRIPVGHGHKQEFLPAGRLAGGHRLGTRVRFRAGKRHTRTYPTRCHPYTQSVPPSTLTCARVSERLRGRPADALAPAPSTLALC